MSVADSWLRQLHGQLWITPETANTGAAYATFELLRSTTLRSPDPPVIKRAEADRVWQEAMSKRTGRPLNILVADDTQANQKVVKAVLARRGHHVEVADNGREALECVRLPRSTWYLWTPRCRR